MKLTNGKLLETLRRKNEGWTTYQARKIAGISIRRVNQVWKVYQEEGKAPVFGRRMGRPKRFVKPREREIVKAAYEQYRVSASTLEKLIERDYLVHLPHRHIHRILISLGFAKPLNKTHKRKKDWVRYERRHGLTAVHIDWYYDPVNEVWVFAVIDDASRKMLALLEVSSATTAWSIEGMRQALKHGQILQCISDHGAQFIHNLSGKSRFKAFLAQQGIKQILCRIKHPQSNGKVEKWFQIYKNHRHAFATKEAFLTWYNEVRPHLSLRFDELETPQEAFIRKMKAEA
ncbi:MAG: DDE-type integrase/transposase/recombinase [Nanoarchaeota archaeon]